MDLSTGGDIDGIRARHHRRLARPDRHGAHLPGAPGAQGRQAAHRRRPHRHARAPGQAGRRLLHHPRRRPRRAPAAREGPHHRHRLARRLDHGAVDDRAPQAEPVLHALGQGPRDLRQVRRDHQRRRRPAPRLPRRRERRGAVRRAEDAGRAHRCARGRRTCR